MSDHIPWELRMHDDCHAAQGTLRRERDEARFLVGALGFILAMEALRQRIECDMWDEFERVNEEQDRLREERRALHDAEEARIAALYGDQ